MAHAGGGGGDPQGRSRGASPCGESRPGGSGCSCSESGGGAPAPRKAHRRRSGSSASHHHHQHQHHHRQQRRQQQQQHLQELQHLESFYERLPPGLVKEGPAAAKPEDCIPDVPGNEHARQFLAQAPTKGLWMPLGREVKVMQCWRCKRYGHRTGDKECPFFIKGNQRLEQFRVAHEDPMYDLIRENKRHEKEMRIQQLKRLLDDATSSSSSSSSSSGGRKKKRKKEKRKKEKRRKKKRKHKASKSDREESDSD